MKSKLFILFVFLLIILRTFSEPGTEEQKSAKPEITGVASHIEISKFQHHNEGELPASQLFSPVFQKTSNLFSSSEKSKKIVRNLIHSKQETRYKVSHLQIPDFGWHSSAIFHIYLKTACIRL